MTRGHCHCAVGIGANLASALGPPAQTIAFAVERLRSHPGIWSVAVSGVRLTDPVGDPAQPRYSNAAACFDTSLAPRALLNALLEIERLAGRVRTPDTRWGPRTLDLDLLVYSDLIIHEDGLTVPHPRLADRLFVLEPLAELEPNMVVPGLGRVADLLRARRGTSVAAPFTI